MKKFVSLVMILVMVTLIFAGCGANNNNSGTSSPTTSPSGNAGEVNKDPYRMGVILYGKEDSLGSMVYSNINYAAKVLGVEVTWALGDYDANAQIASAENLLTSEVDGILCLPLSEIATQKISALCEENEVYFGIMFRTIRDEAIKSEVLSRNYYIGNTTGADKENAKELVKIMAESGKKNVAFYYATPGTSNALRNDGFREAASEYGVKQVAEATIPTDGNNAVMSSTVQNFISTNKDLEGIIISASSGGIGETVVSTLAQMNVKGKVSFACFDIFEGVKEAFQEGYLTAACGGQTPQAVIMFMQIYNAIDGHKLSEEPTEFYQKFIFLSKLEDTDAYEKYIVNPEYQVFDEDDIKNMTVRYNPDLTIDDFQEIIDSYNIENVVKNAESRGK